MAHEGSKFGHFLVGMGIGVVVGFLFAPRSGEETREYLRERYEGTRDDIKRHAQDLRERAEEYAEQGKEFVDRQRESVGAAIDAGKRAYRDERKKS